MASFIIKGGIFAMPVSGSVTTQERGNDAE